jgi:hypothetical protein
MNARRCRVGREIVRTDSLLQGSGINDIVRPSYIIIIYGSGLVRTVGPCAQRRVASGYSRMNGAKRRAVALRLHQA